MLRPAVAVTNCASAGVTSGLVIGRQRLSLKKVPDTVNLRVTGPTKCPGGARSSTRRAGQVIAGPERGVVRPAAPGAVRFMLLCRAEPGKEFPWPGSAGIPEKRRFLPIYQKRPADITMRRAPNPYREDIHSSKLVGFQWIPHILQNTPASPAAFSHRCSWSRPSRCGR